MKYSRGIFVKMWLVTFFRNADREIIKQLNISYVIYLSDTLQEAVLYSKYRLAKGRC